jgi:uncharacterized protein with HEPN domain
MRRSAPAYLSDILEACDAISATLAGVDLETYLAQRQIRSAIEREFLIIGEAVGALGRLDPDLAGRISHARLIVGFRNQLAHAYATIDDEAVLGIAQNDVPVLRSECAALLKELGAAG